MDDLTCAGRRGRLVHGKPLTKGFCQLKSGSREQGKKGERPES